MYGTIGTVTPTELPLTKGLSFSSAKFFACPVIITPKTSRSSTFLFSFSFRKLTIALLFTEETCDSNELKK